MRNRVGTGICTLCAHQFQGDCALMKEQDFSCPLMLSALESHVKERDGELFPVDDTVKWKSSTQKGQLKEEVSL